MAMRPSDRLHTMEEGTELNLAPIMNVVMILIPLLLVSASFLVVATLKVHSPKNAQSVTPPDQEEQEEVPVPRVLVAITEDGFTISDLRQSPAFLASGLGNAIPECASNASPEPGQVPVTVCTRPQGATASRLIQRLNYRGLYNRLVETYEHEAWNAQWDDSNSIINIVADREIPVEVVIRTMDIARFFLENDRYDNEEGFQQARYRTEDSRPVALFRDPVLLLPRAATD